MSTKANPYVKNLLEERGAHVAVIRAIQDRAAHEERHVTDDEMHALEERASAIEKIDADLEYGAKFAAANEKFRALIGREYEARERAERAGGMGGLRTTVDIGRAFAESEQIRAYPGHGTSGRVELPGPASPEFRAAITLGGFENQPTEVAVGPQVSAAAPLLDLLGHVTTSQSVVQFLRTSPETGADVVAEGAVKPEGTGDVDLPSVSLQTVAVWRSVSRQALEDVGQLQAILTDRLLASVRLKLEGLAVGVVDADTDIPDATGPDWTTAIRLGVARVQSLGYTASGVVMHPDDAAAIDLEVLNFVGPGLAPGAMWGLPVVASNAVAAGTAFVGDFRQGVTWFDRGNTQAYLSDSHADFFIRNTLVVLAEARAAFAVTDPAALVKVTAGGE